MLKFSVLYQFDNTTKMIDKFATEVRLPDFIYGNNWGTESIKFFTLKKDSSWRPMAIPNIKQAVMFTYNSLLLEPFFLDILYTKKQRQVGVTSHSESPIIGLDGLISDIFYDEDSWFATGFIGYDDTNKFFEESKLQRFGLEYTYPYILQLDLNKFFENIYTHSFAQINPTDINASTSDIYFKHYLEWLDEFNQKVNDNHTKGIIQGPISSKISAELLQLSIDHHIADLIKNIPLDIHFTRYVDDYRFFARKNSDLELIKHHLTKLFRKYELSFNNDKSLIYKGFEVQKQAHLSRYPEMKIIKNGVLPSVKMIDYISIRELIVNLLSDNDIPTLKSILSILNKKIINDEIKFTEKKITTSMVILLIKTSYVEPILTEYIYNVINAIIEHANKETKKAIWEILYKEITYVEENFSSTDLEAWFFYALATAGLLEDTSKVFTAYKNCNDNNVEKYNVLVLTVLIKPKSGKTNKRIENELLKLPALTKDTGKVDSFWEEVSQTKWWIPITKLWISSDPKKLDKRIQQLFITSRGSINWKQLGLVAFLQKNKK